MTAHERSHFYPRIESLRGLAALMVASAHAWQAPLTAAEGAPTIYSISVEPSSGVLSALAGAAVRVFNNGGGAVNVFFVISGFVLALSLLRGPSAPADSATKFFVSRLFRIYPAVFATVAIFTLVYLLTGASLRGPESYSTANIIRNALLLDVSINGVMWTLQVELIASVVIFVAFFMQRAWSDRALIACFAVLAALAFGKGWNNLIGPSLSGLSAFIVGMYAQSRGRQFIEAIPRAWIPWTFGLAFAAMCLTRDIMGYSSRWGALVESLLAGVVIAHLAFGANGRWGGLFDNPVVRFYGRISYSFYLLHPLTLIVIWNIPDLLALTIRAGVPLFAVGIVLFIASTLAITPLAWLLHAYVERPGIRLAHSLLRALTPRRAPHANEPAPV